jgi:hypothetical protein
MGSTVYMSDFKLNVESPYPIRHVNVAVEARCFRVSSFPNRYYGNNIKYMIDVASKMGGGWWKKTLVKVIANHMKSPI